MGRKSSAVYEVNYHFVWCPKYRKPVLEGEIKSYIQDMIETIAETKGWKVIEVEIMPDHIHLFLSASPFESPTDIIKVLKGVTAKRIFRRFPELKKEFWKSGLWSPSYYVGTAGHVSAETIKRYIEGVKNRGRNSPTHHR